MTLAPSPPLVDLQAVTKAYGTAEPLRVGRLQVRAGDTVVLGGLAGAAAEMFVNLLTGAAVPDEGAVRIDGRDTRTIATDTEWLAALDRFGLVTLRAVLIDALPAAQNLALPLTLSIDPMAPDTRTAVERLADEVALSRRHLDTPVGRLAPADVLRLHLARALAVEPALLLLEHPTTMLTSVADRQAFGTLVASVARRRRLGWMAISDDEDFADATGAERLTLRTASGQVTRRRWWRRLLRTGR